VLLVVSLYCNTSRRAARVAGRRVAAGVMVALACTVRINGLFAAADVVVMFVLSRPGRREWLRSAWPCCSSAGSGPGDPVAQQSRQPVIVEQP
jgi:4-amino-4-deoxy-L-arabinose transferase-like glycosyltransferase